MGTNTYRDEFSAVMCDRTLLQEHGTGLLLAPNSQTVQGISVSTVGADRAPSTSQLQVLGTSVSAAAVAVSAKRMGEPSADIQRFGETTSGIPPRRQTGIRRV